MLVTDRTVAETLHPMRMGWRMPVCLSVTHARVRVAVTEQLRDRTNQGDHWNIIEVESKTRYLARSLIVTGI